MGRSATVERKTLETDIKIQLAVDGAGRHDIHTGIAFFDHMLTLFAIHGFFDLSVDACGDLTVDAHHTVEDVGLVLGDALDQALDDRKGIRRYGYAVTPMDEALAEVALDLAKRPYLIYRLPTAQAPHPVFTAALAKEFFRAFAFRSGMNLHIHVRYGENEHHILESIFKACGRALDQATLLDPRIQTVHSSKGTF